MGNDLSFAQFQKRTLRVSLVRVCNGFSETTKSKALRLLYKLSFDQNYTMAFFGKVLAQKNPAPAR